MSAFNSTKIWLLIERKKKAATIFDQSTKFYAAQFHLIPQNDFSFAISLFLYSRFIPLGRARHDDKLM